MKKCKYKLDDFDMKLLKEARHRISKVVDYNYGAPNSRGVVNRLKTILNKLDELIDMMEDK